MVVEWHTAPSAAVTHSLLAAGGVHENPPHRLRSSREEVAAMIPALPLAIAEQAYVSFMDQSRCVERLPWLLVGQPLCSQAAQFVVHQRQQLLGGVRIAVLNTG